MKLSNSPAPGLVRWESGGDPDPGSPPEKSYKSRTWPAPAIFYTQNCQTQTEDRRPIGVLILLQPLPSYICKILSTFRKRNTLEVETYFIKIQSIMTFKYIRKYCLVYYNKFVEAARHKFLRRQESWVSFRERRKVFIGVRSLSYDVLTHSTAKSITKTNSHITITLFLLLNIL